MGAEKSKMWHVVQNVSRGHNTSYRPGRNFLESYPSEAVAAERADVFNRHRSPQCIGVVYEAIECDHKNASVDREGSTGMVGVVRCPDCGHEREWEAY